MRGRSFVSQWRYTSYTIVLTPSQAFCLRTFDIAWETRNSFLRGKTFLHRGVRFEPPLRAAISLLLNLKRCLVCSPPSYRAERFLESYSSRRLNCTVRLFTPFRDLRNCCFAPESWVSIVFVMSEILFGYFSLVFFFFLFYRIKRYILFVVNKIKFNRLLEISEILFFLL